MPGALFATDASAPKVIVPVVRLQTLTHIDLSRQATPDASWIL